MAKTYPTFEDTPILQELKEALAMYHRSPVGHTATYSYDDFFDQPLHISHRIRRGLPFDLFAKVQLLSPFSEEQWASYLGVSLKTLQRHRKQVNYTFKPLQAEKIIELMEVLLLGRSVFDSATQFYHWLQSPSAALGGERPDILLKDSYGQALVKSELHRIDQGVFA